MVNNHNNFNKRATTSHTNNDLSPQTIEQKKRPQHMVFEIHIMVWDRHKNVAEKNRLMGCQPSDN
jgi:hypothetical protein